MLIANQLSREFVLVGKGQNTVLADPSHSMAPDQVLNFYANTYPELTVAKIIGPEFVEDRYQYRFETVMGTKG